MNRLGLVLLIFSCTAGTGHAGWNWVPFTVTRHVDVTYAESTFDAAMTESNERLKLDNHNCTDDVPCSVRFYRSGSLGVFGTTGDGLDYITTSAELSDVFDVTTHRAKMVLGVDYCGGEYNPSIVGCGRVNGFGFIVEVSQPGNVFVHEYGHNVGLGHRDDCTMNIMHSVTNGANDSLNSSECSTFGGHMYVQLCGNVYDGNGGPLTVSGGPYWLTCNVTVPAGETLTIDPGVEIQYAQGGWMIKSYGSTNADGSSNRINIYSNNQNDDFPSAYIDGLLVISNGGELHLN